MARRLFLDFFTNPSLNALVFFFRNLLPHLSVGGIATQHIGIENRDSRKSQGNHFSLQIIKTPCDRSEQQIKDEPRDRIEEKTKVQSDHDADEFELGFEAANEESTASRVDCQNKGTKGRKRDNFNDLL
jgi:hypothetical protein